MYIVKRKLEKVNKPRSFKYMSLRKMIKSGVAVPSTPLPSGETDFDVNRYANLNNMQRLSLGVYMYDRFSSAPPRSEVSSSPGPASSDKSDDKGSVDSSTTTNTTEV